MRSSAAASAAGASRARSQPGSCGQPRDGAAGKPLGMTSADMQRPAARTSGRASMDSRERPPSKVGSLWLAKMREQPSCMLTMLDEQGMR